MHAPKAFLSANKEQATRLIVRGFNRLARKKES
jgi:hypothetical protein